MAPALDPPALPVLPHAQETLQPYIYIYIYILQDIQSYANIYALPYDSDVSLFNHF